MVRHRLRLLRLTLLLGDAIAAMVLFAAVSMFRLGDGWMGTWLRVGAPWWVWAAAYGALWALAEWLQELDQLRSRWTFRGEVVDIVRAAFVLAVSVFSLLFLVHAPQVSRLFLVVLFASQVVFSIVQRRALRVALVAVSRRGIGTRNLLVLGSGAEARSVARLLERQPALGYHVIGHLGQPSSKCQVLGPLEAIEPILHEGVVDEVIAAFADDEVSYLEPAVALCQEEGKRLRVVLRPGLGTVSGGRVETVGGREILTISNGPDRLIGLTIKRMLDVVGSAVALVLLSPLLAAIAIAIRIDTQGPVFFRQTRTGLHGRPFTMIKYRTMVPDAESRLADLIDQNEISGQAFKMTSDPRITRVGRFLRRTSLDELPQVWNVLIGQMSLVGPRPPIPAEVAGYDLWHRRRLSMKPGITGLWQVSARLDEEFDRWVELDLTYIDRWSLWLDLKIMVRTVPAMLSGR
jgi:exopolysaccharide biosynthesis polyprenyl glycosylphosphotransferase